MEIRLDIRPGPEPTRPRLRDLDADTIARGAQHLIEFAQGRDRRLSVDSHRLLQAIGVATDAARARALLAERKPVHVRWLAALGGVTTARMHALVKSGAVQRVGRLVTAESALHWLQREHRLALPRPLTNAIDVTPSWWHRDLWYTLPIRERITAIANEHRPDSGVLPGERVICVLGDGVKLGSDEVLCLRNVIRAELERLLPFVQSCF
jgi:hypothetical protein